MFFGNPFGNILKTQFSIIRFGAIFTNRFNELPGRPGWYTWNRSTSRSSFKCSVLINIT